MISIEQRKDQNIGNKDGLNETGNGTLEKLYIWLFIGANWITLGCCKVRRKILNDYPGLTNVPINNGPSFLVSCFLPAMLH